MSLHAFHGRASAAAEVWKAISAAYLLCLLLLDLSKQLLEDTRDQTPVLHHTALIIRNRLAAVCNCCIAGKVNATPHDVVSVTHHA